MRMLEEQEEEMIHIRRHLHKYSELSFQEKNTASFITKFYKGKDAKVEEKAENGSGIIVTQEVLTLLSGSRQLSAERD